MSLAEVPRSAATLSAEAVVQSRLGLVVDRSHLPLLASSARLLHDLPQSLVLQSLLSDGELERVDPRQAGAGGSGRRFFGRRATRPTGLYVLVELYPSGSLFVELLLEEVLHSRVGWKVSRHSNYSVNRLSRVQKYWQNIKQWMLTGDLAKWRHIRLRLLSVAIGDFQQVRQWEMSDQYVARSWSEVRYKHHVRFSFRFRPLWYSYRLYLSKPTHSISINSAEPELLTLLTKFNYGRDLYYAIRYDRAPKKLAGSQLNLPHGTEQIECWQLGQRVISNSMVARSSAFLTIWQSYLRASAKNTTMGG